MLKSTHHALISILLLAAALTCHACAYAESSTLEKLIRQHDPESNAQLEQILSSSHGHLSPETLVSLLNIAIQSSAQTSSGPSSDIMRGRDEPIQILLKYGAPVHGIPGHDSPLHAAAKQGDLYWIYYFLDQKCDVNARNASGETPLHEAVWRQVDAARLLLSRGADANATEHVTSRPRTALDMSALYYRNVELTKLLLQYGAKPQDVYRKATQERPQPAAFKETMIIDLLKTAVDGKSLGPKTPPLPRPIMPPAQDSVFIISIKERTTDKSLALLKEGANPNSISAPFVNVSDYKNAAMYGASALHLALLSKDYRLAKQLVLKGAKVNQRSAVSDYTDGNTPLCLAVDDLDMVRFLVEHGANVNLKTSRGLTAVFYAKRPEVITYLAKNGIDLNCTSLSGTALHYAIEQKNVPKVSLLLELKADPNVRKNFDLSPPLFDAISSNQEQIVRLLLKHGANPNLINEAKLNAYEFALHEKKPAMAALLEQSSVGSVDPRNALFQAISDHNVEWVKKLLPTVDINQSSPGQGTYIGAAARAVDAPGKLTIIKLLVEKGADVKNLSGSRGGRDTLLHAIIDPEVVQMVLARDLDVNSTDNSDRTPLHVAAAAGQIKTVEILLAHKANAKLADRSGYTAMHYAAVGPPDQRPGDGPPPDWRGDGPRYIAVIKALMKAGADPLAKAGTIIDTPVSIASKCPDQEFRKEALAAMRH